MSSLTMRDRSINSSSGFGRSVLLGLAVAGAGCLIVWSLGLARGAYFAVAVLATLIGGLVFATRMVAEAPLVREPRLRVPKWLRGLTELVAGTPATPPLLLALTGPSRSGKTEIAAAIAARHRDWARASFGEFVLAEAKRRGIADGDRGVTDRLGDELVRSLGAELFVKKALQEAGIPDKARRLLVDDVYHEDVMRALEKIWGAAISVKVNRIGAPADAMAPESRLDQEADKLFHDLPPQIEIEGATHEDASKRGDELLERVGVQLAGAT